MKVVLASKNKHKLVEISKITEKFGFDLILQSELGVDIDVEETGTTFEENSFIKAEAVMKATGLPALADDSGIAVDALNGEPGIYSARYGFDDSLDDWGRLELLLKNTENSVYHIMNPEPPSLGEIMKAVNKDIRIVKMKDFYNILREKASDIDGQLLGVVMDAVRSNAISKQIIVTNPVTVDTLAENGYSNDAVDVSVVLKEFD